MIAALCSASPESGGICFLTNKFKLGGSQFRSFLVTRAEPFSASSSTGVLPPKLLNLLPDF